jgi:hypothetical protein
LVLTDWPLVGRSEELDFVERQITARAGPAGVVLAGAPGVGKTRLAREVVAAARRRGALTHWLAATESSRRLPLAPFVMTLGSVAGMDPADAMHYLLASLSRGAGPRGVFVGIDDAHLLDDLSAVLVRHLALRRTATAVLTLRTGEPAPDAVSGLWKDGHLVRLEVQPLSREETASLLEAALGGPVDTLAAGRPWRITEGNALYLRQLVDGEWRAGRLTDDAGVWRWSGDVTLSSGLLELLENQIGQLPAGIDDVLDMLALSEPLPAALLVRLAGRDAVERAEARGLVEITGPDHALDARLAHPLYGELRRGRCGRTRGRRLRGEIALALAEEAGGTVLRRAVLTLDSDLAHDPDLLAAGAGRALELLDLPLGIRLARAAAAGHRGFEPRLTLGYALAWSGLGEETESVLADLAGDCATDAELTEVTVCRVGNMFWCLARQHAAEAMLDDAERVVGDPAARLELSAIRSACDAWLARSHGAVDTAARVLADPSSSASAQVYAAWGAATAQCGLGRPSELESALAGVDRSAGTFRNRLLWAGFDVAWNRALRLAGRLADAERAARPYQGSCWTRSPGRTSSAASSAASWPGTRGGSRLRRGCSGRPGHGCATQRPTPGSSTSRYTSPSRWRWRATPPGHAGRWRTWMSRATPSACFWSPRRTWPGPGWPPPKASSARPWRSPAEPPNWPPTSTNPPSSATRCTPPCVSGTRPRRRGWQSWPPSSKAPVPPPPPRTRPRSPAATGRR